MSRIFQLKKEPLSFIQQLQIIILRNISKIQKNLSLKDGKRIVTIFQLMHLLDLEEE